jgi:hypothetical protein
MTDVPSGNGWKDDVDRVGVTIGLPRDMVQQLLAAPGTSLSRAIEARLRHSLAEDRIVEALKRIEAKLGAHRQEDDGA